LLPGGAAPVWPTGGGKRIYAYLKPFAGLAKILKALQLSGCPTIVFGDLDRATQERFAAANIRYEARPLDVRQVAAECDLAGVRPEKSGLARRRGRRGRMSGEKMERTKGEVVGFG
jgi:hypothetical protein